MKEYEVEIQISFSQTYCVDAEDSDEAEKAATEEAQAEYGCLGNWGNPDFDVNDVECLDDDEDDDLFEDDIEYSKDLEDEDEDDTVHTVVLIDDVVPTDIRTSTLHGVNADGTMEDCSELLK